MRVLAVIVGLFVVGACLPPAGGPRPFATLCRLGAQPSASADTMLALIEIPAGGRVKYEFNAQSGLLRADRVLPDSMAYPAAYGAFPCTLAGDGDPLDHLLLTSVPLEPGTLVPVRPIAVLRMTDRGAQDDKLITVLVSDTTSTVSEATQRRIRQFFQNYKASPAASPEVGDFEDAAAARRIAREAIGAAQRN